MWAFLKYDKTLREKFHCETITSNQISHLCIQNVI